MKPRTTKSALTLALLALCGTVYAEDIDLFVGTPSSTGGLPNVLFVVDNTANWNSAFSNEMSALVNTFNNLPVNSDGSAKFNIGIMLANETGSPNNNVKGGYVRAAIRPMTSANRAKYAALIGSLDKLNDKGNGGYAATTMAETYYYFSSGTPYAGNNKAKTDYTGNTTGNTQSNAVYALTGNALATVGATRYTGPTVTGCTKNYIIFISNGPNQENNSSTTQANNFLTAAGGSAAQISLSPTGSADSPVDEWARFLKKSSLGVVTYTIDVDPPSTGQGPGWTALLKSAAKVSDGKYTKVNSATGGGSEISTAINKALSEIQAVNSVFASVSLPLSVNTRGTYSNQVYIGLFRPDANAYPRWAGNLKQFKIGEDGGDDLELQDADDRSAVNVQTGFITECARSYWTPTVADAYWSFKPQGACIPPTNLAADAYQKSDFPDGNIVEKGAQSYKQRTATTRNLKTCSTSFSSCTSLTDFNTANTNITQAALGATSSTERDALINWARGTDIDDENGNASTTDNRASVHGDVVHSRPVAIDFGSASTPKVVVFYGGNDGVFRAVNGNRSASIGSVPAGGELWSFVPPEFYDRVKHLRDNSTQVAFPNVTATTTIKKPYGIDGAISSYYDSSRAWIYGPMRRGGRALYSFNVDRADPSNIGLKWKKGCPSNFPASGAVNDSGCTVGFEGMGQAWSSPKSLKSPGHTGPMIIMGGGYDTCEDANPNTCTAANKGNKVYVMDADTGNLLKTFSTDRGVVTDITVVNDSATGNALYAYAADLGGNVYRIDIGNAAPTAWSITKIAALGCATATTCTDNRKFMFAPDVVMDNGTYVLLIGSGDREKPRNYSNPVSNYFFMLRDKPSDATWLSAEAGNCGGASIICLNSLFPITSSSTPSSADLSTKAKGWYLGLRTNEQVVTASITIFGTVTFSTNEPQVAAVGVCSSNLGIARVYNISYKNAAPLAGETDRAEELPPGIGLPPSPVGGVVVLDDGSTKVFCIGCSPKGPPAPKVMLPPTTGAPNQPKSRVYWYIER